MFFVFAFGCPQLSPWFALLLFSFGSFALRPFNFNQKTHRILHIANVSAADPRQNNILPTLRQSLQFSAPKTNGKIKKRMVGKIYDSVGERKKKAIGQRKSAKGSDHGGREQLPRIPSHSLSESFEKGMVERRRHPDELAPLSQPLGRGAAKWDMDNSSSEEETDQLIN